MGTLIDSSVLIEAERGRLDLAAKVEESPAEEFFLAAITASEVLHGLYRAATAEQKSRREAFVAEMLSSFEVLAFDLSTGRIHARVGAEVRATGVTVGAHDLMIAATAMANGLQVATRDLRSFPRIPRLVVVRW